MFETTITVHHFQTWKVIKKSQNTRNQGFSYYFYLMIGGSGSGPRTNGSGSGEAQKHPNPQHCYVQHCWRTQNLDWVNGLSQGEKQREKNADYFYLAMDAVLYAELHEVDLDLLVQLDPLLHDDGARALLQLEVGEPDTTNTRVIPLCCPMIEAVTGAREPNRNRVWNTVGHWYET